MIAIKAAGDAFVHQVGVRSFDGCTFGGNPRVSNPQPGDVVIFDFGGNDHHVTLFVKDNGNGTWSCHGGNQGHQVIVANFYKSNVMGIRRPIPVVQAADIPLVPSVAVAPVASGNQRFNACVLLVLHDEGGNDDDPDDPGGRTSRGITQTDWNDWLRTHPSLAADVFQAPQDQMVAIYHDNYWNKLSCDDLPSGDYGVFDYGVLSGIGHAAKVLQGYVGAAVDGEIGPQTCHSHPLRPGHRGASVSNSETDSIHLNASRSRSGSRPATYFATRRRTARDRGSATIRATRTDPKRAGAVASSSSAQLLSWFPSVTRYVNIARYGTKKASASRLPRRRYAIRRAAIGSRSSASPTTLFRDIH